MSAIKRFFEKKKTEAKFKLAGKGQKLGEAQAASQPQAARAGPSQPAQSRSGPAARGLTHEQRQAAEAALSRSVLENILSLLVVLVIKLNLFESQQESVVGSLK
jgi:hypothetical protein